MLYRADLIAGGGPQDWEVPPQTDLMLTADEHTQNNLLSDASVAVQLLAACPDALLLVDERRNIQYANRAAVQISGYDYDEVVGLSLKELVPPEERRWLAETAQEADQLAKVSCVCGKLQHRDGTVVPVEVSVSKLESGQGAIYMVVARETAERVQLTEEALHAEHMRALGEIASGVAHDFRNVLAAILGRSQLLLMKVADPQMREALQAIEKAALDGGETVKRIMRYGSPEPSGEEFVPVDLNELLKEVIESTRYRWFHEPQVEGRRIELEARLTPVPLTEGSPSELRQFFTNLIMNACDAMPDGGRLAISTQSGPTTITVTIADTGEGMAPEVQERIFDAFFTTKGGSSLGLGLALGKQSVSRHGGQITVGSSVGEGTIFTITLPRIVQDLEDASSESPAVSATDHAAQILVVEDEPVLRDLLRESVVTMGHDVRVASRTEEALQLINIQHYDVVITDLGMPDIPGSKVAQAAKQASGETHVILLTGWDNPLSPTQSTYVDQILIKPASVADLSAAIEAGLAA